MPAGNWIVKEGEKPKLVADADLPAFRKAGWRLRDEVAVETETGRRLVDPDKAEKLERQGGTLAPTQGGTPERQKYLAEQERGQLIDPWSQSEALGAAIHRGQTLGLSDLFYDETGLIDKERLAGLRSEYGKTSMAGELTGVLSGAAAGAGPVGLVGKLGTGVAKKVGGKVIGAAAGGAAEGFVFGGAGAINNMYLADREFSAESVLAEAGSGALYGGAIGGSIGLIGGAVAKGVDKAKSVLNKPTKVKDLQRANPIFEHGSQANVSFRKELASQVGRPTTARKAALEAIDDIAAAEAKKFGPSYGTSGKLATEARAMAAEAQALDDTVLGAIADKTEKGFKLNMEKIGKLSGEELRSVARAAKQSDDLTHQLTKKAGIEYEPVKLMDTLGQLAKREGGAFERLTPAELAAVGESLGLTDVSDLVADATGSELAGTIVNIWASQKSMRMLAKRVGGKRVTPGQDLGPDEVQPMGAIERGVRNLVRYKTRGGASGTIGNQPAFYLGNLVGNLGRSTGGAKERIATGVNKFVKTVGGAARSKAATPSAVAVLSKVRFDPDIGEVPDKSSVYKLRKAELDRAMANPQATAERVRQKLAPIAHINPEMGQLMHEKAMQKLGFYYEKSPKNPIEKMGLYRSGRWEPPASEVARFARYVRAGEDPLSVLDDMNAGKITPEAIEAIKTIYPDTYQKIQFQLIDQLSEPGAVEALSYSKRVQLAIFFELPTDPTLTPGFYASMQDLYVMRQEQAQQGNQQYSTPGAVSKAPGLTELPTAAQRIEQ